MCIAVRQPVVEGCDWYTIRSMRDSIIIPGAGASQGFTLIVPISYSTINS